MTTPHDEHELEDLRWAPIGAHYSCPLSRHSQVGYPVRDRRDPLFADVPAVAVCLACGISASTVEELRARHPSERRSLGGGLCARPACRRGCCCSDHLTSHAHPLALWSEREVVPPGATRPVFVGLLSLEEEDSI